MNIVPHLWYDKEAGQASEFYVSIFEDSKIIDRTMLQDTPSGTVEMLTIVLAGQEFMLLSGGPFFHFNPSVSFVITCNNKEDVIRLWDKLIVDGQVLMPLEAYPFSEKYGWLTDKFGLSWQIMYAEGAKEKLSITPALMFVGDQCGKAEEAVNYYVSVFDHSKMEDILRYDESDLPNRPGTVKHMEYTLLSQRFAAMDSAYDHDFMFNEAISFVVNCDTQEEIDYVWDKLSAVPEAEQCGWIKDRYGLSWQITPNIMNDIFKKKDPEILARVTQAFLKMKKFDIAEIIRVYEG